VEPRFKQRTPPFSEQMLENRVASFLFIFVAPQLNCT